MKGIQRPVMLNQRGEGPSVSAVFFSVLLVLVLVLLVAENIFISVYTPVNVDGSSMYSTLEDGDWVYASEGEVHRGDIVTIDVSGYKTERGTPVFQKGGVAIGVIIKRVIAVEGDSVRCVEGKVELRRAGEEEYVSLEEPYATGLIGGGFPETEVKEGEIFVLGDNRPTSHDSSEEGCLLKKDVLGVVAAWSLERKESVTRWESFRDGLRSAFGLSCA